MPRIDPHVKILDERVVRRAKRRGLDALVYAPHFTRLPEIERQARRYRDDELAILPARELFTGPWRHRRHLLAIGLDEPVPDYLTFEATLAELERQEAAILVPHPTYFSISLSADDVRDHRDRLHGIEVYNPKYLPHHHRRTRGLAAETGLPPFASSYAHLRGTIGEVWIELDEPMDEVETLRSALVDDLDCRIGYRDGVAHAGRRLAEIGHVGWENSWQKLTRVLREDLEATHPRHPAYEGRFVEMAVY